VRERRAAAQSDLDEAEQAAADAAEVLGGAEAAVEDVERRHTELEEEIDGIQARLRALRDEQIALTVRERRAHAARDAAARAVDAAARRVRSVRERLEKLD